MSAKKKTKKKLFLHPVMTFILLILGIVVISGILSLFNISVPYTSLNGKDLQVTYKTITNLFTLGGVKEIFSTTVSNFANFAPLSHLIIALIGIGVMDYSGFLKVAVGIATKHVKKTTITFFIVFLCMIASIMENLPFVAFIPLSALIFRYGKRNPNVGVVCSFASLTCGYGLSVFFTATDSSLLRYTLSAASVISESYTFGVFASLFIMLVAIISLSILITSITENRIVDKLPKYDFEETEIFVGDELSNSQIRGLFFAFIGAFIYILVFVYNIIPGVPLGGAFLNYSEGLYIDKLFGINSFFSNGFVFIITMLFIIIGLLYGIGAKTISGNHEIVASLGHSLNGIGKALVIIFAGSTFISIYKQTHIGDVIATVFANIISASGFSGIGLIILLFVLTAIITFVLPGSTTKWEILSYSVIPAFLNVGLSPGFAQIIFRFAESSTMGLTPLFAYFMVYLAFLDKYNQDDNHFTLKNALSYQLPYSIATFGILLAIVVIWYIIGLPLGVGGSISI